MFEIDKRYIIMEKFNLPWAYVSPLSLTAMEYHLNEDLSLRMDGIRCGDTPFVIGSEILALENYKVEGDLEVDFSFRMNILSMKSKERVAKVFKGGDSKLSCFLNERQMEAFEKLFEENHFSCSDLAIFYKGQQINDVYELPKKEFALVMSIFDDLNVLGTMDYKSSNKALTDEYVRSLNAKVATAGDETKKSMMQKIKGKGMKKDMAITAGTVLLSSIGFVAKHMLVKRSGIGSGIAAVIFSCIGIVSQTISIKRTQKILINI